MRATTRSWSSGRAGSPPAVPLPRGRRRPGPRASPPRRFRLCQPAAGDSQGTIYPWSAANWRANAAPMPWAAPVIEAVPERWSRLNMAFLFYSRDTARNQFMSSQQIRAGSAGVPSRFHQLSGVRSALGRRQLNARRIYADLLRRQGRAFCFPCRSMFTGGPEIRSGEGVERPDTLSQMGVWMRRARSGPRPRHRA